MIITTQPGAEDPSQGSSCNGIQTEQFSAGGYTEQEVKEEEDEESNGSDSTALHRSGAGRDSLADVLDPLDGVFIKQKMEVLEALTGYETSNQYEVRTLSGEPLFHVKEESSSFVRNCCGRFRGFKMHVNDYSGNTVAELERATKCCRCQCMLFASSLCFRDGITIEAPPDNKIGSVQQRSGCTLDFNVYEDGNIFAYIKGPSCCGYGWCTSCLPNKKFKVHSQSDGSEIGMITKLFSGIMQESFTDADNFRVTFPVNMSVNQKMILIGAVFLIDFIAFEDNAGATGQV